MLSKSICFAVIGGLLVALVGCGGSSSKSADSAGGDDVALDVSTADLADTSTGGDFIVTGDTTPSDALQTCEPPLGTPATDNCSGTDDRSALASANPAEA
ncbi:MAG: hypothetical protein KC609_25715, partial [Myxococcales bacterium]|nr:hypothetical protein [Myxococcales bacterium]